MTTPQSKFVELIERMEGMGVRTFRSGELRQKLQLSKMDLKLLLAYGLSSEKFRVVLHTGHGTGQALYELVTWRSKWIHMPWRSDDGQLTNKGA